MMFRPNQRLIALVDAALGETPAASLGELTPAEERRLSELRALAVALISERFAAPSELVERAKAIFPAPKTYQMQVSSSAPQMSGARGAAEVVHFAYDSVLGSARVMYVLEAKGWRVVGQAPGSGWSVVCGDVVVETDESGRFEILTSEATIPTISFFKDGSKLLVVPPDVEP